MKKLAIGLGFAISLFFVACVVVVAINSVDDELSPAALTMIKGMELEVEPREGFDYLLGFTSSGDEDPLVAGRTIREELRNMRDANTRGYRIPVSMRLRHVESESKWCEGVTGRPIYCGKDWYLAHWKEVEKLGQQNAFLFSRFAELIDLASFDTEPSARSLIDSNILEIQKLLRIQQDFWGMNWAFGNRDNVIRYWVKTNRFLNRWLEANPISLVEASIVLQLLETQKQLALEVLKSAPTAATDFNSDNLLTLKPTVSFDRLKDKIAVSEFTFFHAVARKRQSVGAMLDSELSYGPSDPASVLYKIPVPLYKWNATLNDYVERLVRAQNDPCVTDATPCQPSSKNSELSIHNPIGKYFVATLNPSSLVYEEMHQRYLALSGL